MLDLSTQWSKSATSEGGCAGLDRGTCEPRWTAISIDLAFGPNTELRVVAGSHAANDAQAKFVSDFAQAWTKVMNRDRFDLH